MVEMLDQKAGTTRGTTFPMKEKTLKNFLSTPSDSGNGSTCLMYSSQELSVFLATQSS